MHYALYGELEEGFVEFFNASGETQNGLDNSPSLTSRCIPIRICGWKHTDPDPAPGPYVFQVPLADAPHITPEGVLAARDWTRWTIYDCGDPVFGTQDYEFGANSGFNGGGDDDGDGGSGGGGSSAGDPPRPQICNYTGGTMDGGIGADPELPESVIEALEEAELRVTANAFLYCNGISEDSEYGQFLLENFEFTAQIQAINAGPGSEEEKARAIYDVFLNYPIFTGINIMAVIQEALILRTLAENDDDIGYWDMTRIIAQAYWNVYSGRVHTMLDLVGLVPGLGEPADVINGLIYVMEGDAFNATISFAATIPIIGSIGPAGRIINKVFTVVSKPGGGTIELVFNKVDDIITFCSNGFTGCGSQLRKVLGGVAGDGKHAHHLIPKSIMDHPVVQEIAETGGFHMNHSMNGTLIPSANHLVGHSRYTNLVRDVLNNGVNSGRTAAEVLDTFLAESKKHFTNGGTVANFQWDLW